MAEKTKFEPKKYKTKTQEIVGALPPNFPLGPEKFENESSGEQDVPEAKIDEEVEAIDEMLEGKDEKFNKLKY